MSFAKVKNATSEEVVEVPVEEDGTVLLSTLKSQFSHAIGLKYLNNDTGAFRAVRMKEDKFECPEHLLDWETVTFTVVIEEPEPVSAKRGPDEEDHPSKRANDGAPADATTTTTTSAEGTTITTTTTSSTSDASKAPTDVPRTGGKECYNCGGTGHIASLCTSPPHAKQSMGSDFTCHVCHGKGHMQASCPSRMSNNTCYQCHMVGHRARDCPNNRGNVPYGRGGNDYFRPRPGPAQKSCYTCGEFGHIASSCPRGATGEKICHICQEAGHIARDCNKCKICKKPGHRSYDCPDKHLESQSSYSRDSRSDSYNSGGRYESQQPRYQPDPYRNQYSGYSNNSYGNNNSSQGNYGNGSYGGSNYNSNSGYNNRY